MRNSAWLKKALSSLDFVYFKGQLANRGVQIHWFRPPKTKDTFLYAECVMNNGPIRINTVLAHDWVPHEVVLQTIFHECLHVLVGVEHSPYFELLEKQFPQHSEVALWESDSHSLLLTADRPYVRDVR